MAADDNRVRNGVLLAAALGCIVYAAFAMGRFWQRPRVADRDEVLLVCTKCAAESTLRSAEFAALELDENTLAVPCPKCGESAAYPASMRCPECNRGIPNTPGLFGTDYVCPYCKAPLGTIPDSPE